MGQVGAPGQCRVVLALSFLAALGEPNPDCDFAAGRLCGSVEAQYLPEYSGALFAKHHWFAWVAGAGVESQIVCGNLWILQ